MIANQYQPRDHSCLPSAAGFTVDNLRQGHSARSILASFTRPVGCLRRRLYQLGATWYIVLLHGEMWIPVRRSGEQIGLLRPVPWISMSGTPISHGSLPYPRDRSSILPHDYSLGGGHVAQSPELRSRHLKEVATCVGRDDTDPEHGPRRNPPRDHKHGPYQRHRRPPSDTRGLNRRQDL